ncbi:MAG: hypothetical protein WCO44_09005 [Bacteroidota bacterium]
MVRFFFTFLLVVASIAMKAQSDGIHPGDPGFKEKYAGFDFKGHFAMVIDRDAENTYFLLDFRQLPSRFERVYFMNLSFGNYKIVNLDPVVTEDKICFKSNKQYGEREITAIFDDLKKRTTEVSVDWAESIKQKWLTENDKYK